MSPGLTGWRGALRHAAAAASWEELVFAEAAVLVGLKVLVRRHALHQATHRAPGRLREKQRGLPFRTPAQCPWTPETPDMESTFLKRNNIMRQLFHHYSTSAAHRGFLCVVFWTGVAGHSSLAHEPSLCVCMCVFTWVSLKGCWVLSLWGRSEHTRSPTSLALLLGFGWLLRDGARLRGPSAIGLHSVDGLTGRGESFGFFFCFWGNHKRKRR